MYGRNRTLFEIGMRRYLICARACVSVHVCVCVCRGMGVALNNTDCHTVS